MKGECMRHAFSRRATRVAAGVCAVVATLAVGGCAKHITQVNADYVMPEGTPSANARLVLWYDAPQTMTIYRDRPPIGRDPGDQVIGTQEFRIGTAGSIHAMILDSTDASRFQALRRESGGGYRAFQDFTLGPTRRWLSTQWEIFRFDDTAPSGFTPATYVARGELDGAATPRSPLTNAAALTQTALNDIPFQMSLDVSGGDTVSVLQWSAVANAERYIVHVYEFRQATSRAQILSGLPSPVYDGYSRDYLLLSVNPASPGAAPATNYRMGALNRPDVEILFQRELLPQPDPSYRNVLVRITAVDGQGRLIAQSVGSSGQAPVDDGVYGLYPLGAYSVSAIRLPRPH